MHLPLYIWPQAAGHRVDHFTSNDLATMAMALILGLPVFAVTLWKIQETVRRRRWNAHMKAGNRRYKDWLDSSSDLSRRE